MKDDAENAKIEMSCGEVEFRKISKKLIVQTQLNDSGLTNLTIDTTKTNLRLKGWKPRVNIKS